jgi:outer membrane protein assembly factor BamB
MSWDEKVLARKSIIYSGIAIFGLALIAGLLTHSNISGVEDNGNGSVITLSQEQIRNNWNGFRGPGGLGIAYQENIPTHWDGNSGENVIWKTEISTPGYNSPIVWEDKIFLSAANKTTQEVYCLSSESGEILWKTELNNITGTPAKKPKVTKDTGYAAPTMTTDGKNVYVIYATGDVAALNFEGEQIWSKNIGVPDNHYGHSSSLILYNNILIIQFDHSDGQFLIGLRGTNGDEVYKTARADVQISWASPALIETADGPQVVLNSSPFVVSYNPLNGQELWRVDCMYGEVGPSIAFGNQTVFAVNDMAILAAIEPGNEPKIIWEYDEDLSEASSPVATEDYLFLASGIGIISCFDVKTGEQYWFNEFDEGFYSSPIVVGELVYTIDKKGITHIIKADRNFELVSQPVLGEDAVATPAFMPGRIYIRSNNHLYCIGNKDG